MVDCTKHITSILVKIENRAHVPINSYTNLLVKILLFISNENTWNLVTLCINQKTMNVHPRVWALIGNVSGCTFRVPEHRLKKVLAPVH